MKLYEAWKLIEVKPHRYFTGRYDWQQHILNLDNRVEIEPFQILMVLEWKEEYCKLLLNDRVCYLHESLVNLTNFTVVSPANHL